MSSHSVSILGRDFSGTVEAVGQAVHRFKPGDEVSINWDCCVRILLDVSRHVTC